MWMVELILSVFLLTSLSPDLVVKSGYLWYAETKTFGTNWTRLYFAIKKGMLVSAEVCVCIA